MRLLYEPLTDIPVGFQEVEYLESTGTQYIDLGFVVDSNKKIELGFSATSNQETKVPVGVYNGIFWTYIVYTYGANGLVTFNNSTVNTLGSFNTNKHDMSVDYKNLTYTYDGVSNTLAGTPRDYELNLYLFGRNNKGNADALFNGLKVYYLRAYDNGVLIRDMVPCLDKSNVPCLWDKVDGKAYYNSGTGDFNYGRQIIPVEYLQADGNQYINTGYKPSNTTGVYAKIQYVNTTKEDYVAVGTWLSNNRFVAPFRGSANTGNWYSGWGNREPSAGNSIDTNVHEIYLNYKNDRNISVDTTSITSGISAISGNWKPLFIFSRNLDGTPSGNMVGKIYGVEITEGTNVVCNYIPAIDENNVGFMFDKMSHTVYTNAGTGSFLFGKMKKKKKLRLIYDWNNRVPRGFKEVEYIQSSGTQYINTGFIPTGNTGIDMRFLITGRGSGGNDSNIIMSGGDSANCRCGFGYRSSSDTTYGHTLQVSGICATGSSWENYAMATNAPHTVLYNYDNQKKCYLDGVLKRENIPYGTATVTYPMFIFSSNMNGASWRTSSLKLYYCKIVDNGVLVRDFIPCLDSSNVPCLWDRITKKAYYNKGTGDFTYGQKIIQVKYLESNGNQYIDTGWSPKSNDLRVAFKVKSVSSPHTTAICGAEKTNIVPRWVFIMYGQNADTTKTFPLTGNWNNTTNGFTFTSGTVLDIDWTTSKSSTTITDKVSNTTYTYNFGTDITYSNNDVTLKLFCNAVTQKSAIQMSCYKIWDNNELVRDYIAVKDENGFGYMFDTISHSLYANVGTGSFVVGEAKKDVLRFIDDEIPSTYQRVNWLKASGAQYIDTGIDGKSGLKAKIGFEWGPEDIGNDRYVLAAADGYYGRCYFGTFQSKWMYGYSSYWQAGTPEANKYYDAEVSWELNNQYLKIDGETLITQTLASALDVRNTMFMFARNQGGPNWYSYAKIYYCQMWENGIMVRNYVPVIRKSDNKPGMYDRITKQFYVNNRAGVADFTYG